MKLLRTAVLGGVALLAAGGFSAETAEPPAGAALVREPLAAAAGVAGGLCVQVGAEQLDGAAALAKTGRCLVQVLDPSEEAVEQARRRLQSSGLYGLISLDRWRREDALPYTENLVNRYWCPRKTRPVFRLKKRAASCARTAC